MKITLSTLCDIKSEGQKFTAVSCYDYTSAQLVAAAGVEVLLAGDSAAQFMLGFDSTLPVTTDFMITITAAVRRAAPNLFLVADMPFKACSGGTAKTLKNAEKFIAAGGADIVKIEVAESQIKTIKAVIDAGIDVMPHIGIRPQTGQLKAQGTVADSAAQLVKLADKMCDIGAKMLLLEGTAREVAQIITQRLSIPVIGCGSGPNCDGQVLVLPDILKLTRIDMPKFSKSFADVGKITAEAIALYAKEVREGLYPDDAHCYHIKSGEYDRLKELIS
ncbi:MAG: 3-methyl-2-oxobutanoate hydroxymethyltransferase [Sedimentisphaerales bacterium]|nr:3-methyl-2-oxobutanoate hydroxymethyltransferase [Sedimentisphaerales bacterium]